MTDLVGSKGVGARKQRIEELDREFYEHANKGFEALQRGDNETAKEIHDKMLETHKAQRAIEKSIASGTGGRKKKSHKKVPKKKKHQTRRR